MLKSIELSTSYSPVASAGVCSEAVVQFFFSFLALLSLFAGFVLCCSTLCHLMFDKHLARKQRAGFFTFVVF